MTAAHNIKEFAATIEDHTPYNKHCGEVTNSVCEVVVKDYDGSGPRPDAWTTILLHEHYTPEGGKKFVARTISVQLNQEQRAALIAALQGGA